MKFYIFMLLASLCLIGSAFAADSPCNTKIKNAASYAIAQEVGVPVQGVEVVRYIPGPWTEAAQDNMGSDQVIVRVGNRINRGMTIRTYEVAGKQIGDSADCDVTAINKIR